MKIPNKVRYINKKFTNRLMIRIAGKNHSPICLIEHVGRHSGKHYRIPIMAAPQKTGLFLPLPTEQVWIGIATFLLRNQRC